MSATDDTLKLEAVKPPPHPPAHQRTRRIRERAPWGIPLAIGAWVLSFNALTDAALASGYVGDATWKAWLWAGIIDYSVWVGYVGLRRDARSARSWVMLGASSGATLYFQAHWGSAASWVPPVALLLALWVLERPDHPRPRRTASAPSAPAPPPADMRRDAATEAARPAAGELDAPASAPDALRDLVERIHLEREVRGGQKLVAAELARELNRSEGYVRNVLRDMRRAHRDASGAPRVPHRPHQGAPAPAPELNGTAPQEIA